MIPAIELIEPVYELYQDSSNVLSDWEEDFIVDLHTKAQQKPEMILSAKQEEKLVQIREKLEDAEAGL